MTDRDSVILGLLHSAQGSIEAAMRMLSKAEPESAPEPGEPCPHPAAARKTLTALGDEAQAVMCMACGELITDG